MYASRSGARPSWLFVRISVLIAVLLTVFAFLAAQPGGALASGPLNDDFPGTAIAGLPFTDSRDTAGAGVQPGEPQPPCMFEPIIAATVWYSFAPSQDVFVSASTEGSSFDTVLGIWTISDFPGGQLASVACGDDTAGSFNARAAFMAEAGRTYYLQVGGYPFDPNGQLELDVREIMPPGHDLMADAVVIPSIPFTHSTNTLGAGTEPDEPANICTLMPVQSSVWYTFTPAQDAMILADASGSDFDTVITVFSDSGGGLEEVACNDDFGFSLSSTLAFAAEAGRNYYLQVGGFPHPAAISAGFLELSLQHHVIPQCPADQFQVSDPAGDTFGTLQTRHDIRGVSVATGPDVVCLTVDFGGPIDPPGEKLNQLFGWFVVDADQDESTGIPAFADGLCGAPSHMGTESFGVYGPSFGLLVPMLPLGDIFFSGAAAYSRELKAHSGPPPLPEAPFGSAIYGDSSATLVMPLAALGGDSEFNFNLLAGTVVEPNDCLPDEGFVDSSPTALIRGDVDCNGVVSAVDSLQLLRHIAQLATSQNEPCAAIGSGSPVWGDLNCDSAVTSIDALLVSRHVAGLEVNLPPGCPPIDSPA